MKLKNLSVHKVEDVPDYILEEIFDLTNKMVLQIMPLIDDKHPNITMAALNFLLANYMNHVISEDPEQIKIAAKMTAISLIKNIEMLTNVDILEDET